MSGSKIPEFDNQDFSIYPQQVFNCLIPIFEISQFAKTHILFLNDNCYGSISMFSNFKNLISKFLFEKNPTYQLNLFTYSFSAFNKYFMLLTFTFETLFDKNLFLSIAEQIENLFNFFDYIENDLLEHGFTPYIKLETNSEKIHFDKINILEKYLEIDFENSPELTEIDNIIHIVSKILNSTINSIIHLLEKYLEKFYPQLAKKLNYLNSENLKADFQILFELIEKNYDLQKIIIIHLYYLLQFKNINLMDNLMFDMFHNFRSISSISLFSLSHSGFDLNLNKTLFEINSNYNSKLINHDEENAIELIDTQISYSIDDFLHSSQFNFISNIDQFKRLSINVYRKLLIESITDNGGYSLFNLIDLDHEHKDFIVKNTLLRDII
jgi:hypothetical protein